MLQQAQKLLQQHGSIVQQSSIYKTAAWGNTQQDSFYNQALVLETPLSANNLLTAILKCEEEMGRKRQIKWEPRVIDIDIIFFNNHVIETETLTVPHPHMQDRNFVLAPLNEIMPNFIHPQLNKSIAQLYQSCSDALNVEKL